MSHSGENSMAQPVDSGARKRTLDTFLMKKKPEDQLNGAYPIPSSKENQPAGPATHSNENPLQRESSAELTDSGSSTPVHGDPASPAGILPARVLNDITSHKANLPPSISTEAATSASLDSAMVTSSAASLGNAPLKRKRLTAEDKERQQAEKKQKTEEREKKRREKEEAEKVKAEAKAAKAAVKAEQEAEKKRLADEKAAKKREKEDADAKKARAQMRLTSMFASTPKKETATKAGDGASPAGTPVKKTDGEGPTLYEQLFRPFFVKDNVKLAPTSVQMDKETLAAKSRIFDSHMAGEAKEVNLKEYDWIESLQIPFKITRGCTRLSVKKVMADYSGTHPSVPVDLTTESQNDQIRLTSEALKSIPMKTLKFFEDVRPAYVGTMTSNIPDGAKSLRKLARNPLCRTALPLNYDYDSEAEWQEEDGEDVDLDEEEDEQDNEEDMGDFLDDSEDAGPARPQFGSSMEPDSTGLCWENHKRLGPLPKMYKYRMEWINDTLDHHHSIDPWSTAYWAPIPKPAPAAPAATNPAASTSSMPPPPANALQALTQGATAAATNGKQPPRLQLTDEEKLKIFILEHANLSRNAVVEIFASAHETLKKAHIKRSLDLLTERTGSGKQAKLVLKETVA